jgi:PAS domain S-box-containing protein
VRMDEQLLREVEDLRKRLKETEEALDDLRYREEELRKSEQEKTAILNSLSEEVTYLDMDMRVLWTNMAAKESAWLGPERLLGCYCYDVWCQNGEPRIDCPAARTIRTGQRELGEISIPDGRAFLHRSYPTRDAKGNIVGTVVITLDITERKQAEKVLRESENAYRTLAENLPGMVYRVFIRENNRMEFFNNMLQPMTGYAAEELTTGRVCSIEPLILTEDREAVVRIVERAILEHQPFEVEYRLGHKEGETRFFLERGRPIYGEDGNPLYIDGVILDITARKVAEEALRKSHEEKAVILNATQEAMGLLGTNLKLVWSNRICADRAGLPPEEMAGRYCYEMWAQRSEPCVGCPTLKTIETGRPKEAEISSPDGGIWLHRSYPVRDVDGNIQSIVATALDITERKRNEEELRKHAQILDQIHDSVISTDLEGYVVSWNKGAERIFGYSAEEGLGKHISFVYPPDQHEFLQYEVIKPLKKKGRHEIEVKMRRKSDEDFYAHLSLSMLKNKEGLEIGMIGSSVDLTERRQMEEELRRSRDELEIRVQERTANLLKANQDLQKTTELMEKLFSNINIMIAYTDKDFNFLRVNRTLAEDDGRDPEFFVGKNLFDLFPNIDKKDFMKVVETGEPNSGYEKPFIHPEHPERGVTYWEWGLQPVKEPDGKVAGVVTSFVNVTERKRAEKVAKDEQAFRKTIEESILVGITVIDLEGRKVYVNPAFCRMVGWSAEELLGAKPPFVFWPPEEIEKLTEAFTVLISNKEMPQRFEQRFQRKNGERFDVLILNAPLKDDQGRLIGWVGSIGDITERKRAEEALRESEKRLRFLSSQLITAQEQERKRIASELHDGLASGLSGIKFKVEGILEQRGQNRTEVQKQLESVIKMIQESVEEVRRIQTDLRPATLDSLGVLATIRGSCRKFQEIYPSVSIQQQINIKEDEIPASLKIVIYRILQEALNNIAKHSQADLVRLSFRKKEGRIELMIQDNGRGFNVKEALSAQSSIGGLGLTTMRERTELSGGIFAIESTGGNGTLIMASWPV